MIRCDIAKDGIFKGAVISVYLFLYLYMFHCLNDMVGINIMYKYHNQECNCEFLKKQVYFNVKFSEDVLMSAFLEIMRL